MPTLVASAAVLGALGAGAVVADEATHTNSAELFKALKDAHDDLTAKKYADAISKLKAAEAAKGKTPYDQHVINDHLAFAYVRTGAYADAAKTLEAEVDDGFTSPADQQQKLRALAALSYQLKNYDKAIEYGQRAINGGHGDDEMQKVVGQAYYLKGDWKSTIDFEDELATRQIERGETPSKDSLLLLYSACFKIQDSDCETRAFGLLRGHYPGAWRPDLKAPPPPQRGRVMAFFFGPPESLEGQKPPK